jgi:hypothetical protein
MPPALSDDAASDVGTKTSNHMGIDMGFFLEVEFL